MQITIDERQCGAGKTTSSDGIYETLIENYSSNQPTLIVLPSIKLADDYKQNGLAKIKKINSSYSKNIELDLITAMVNNEPAIAITKEAFINIQINDGLKRKYALIIDEAIDSVWDFVPFDQDKDDKILADWSNIMHTSPSLTENDYSDCTIDDLMTNSFFKKSTDIKKLSRQNFNILISTKQAKEINKGKKFKILFIQELKKEVLSGWDSIHIAASRFEMTFMSLWMKKHDLDYSVKDGCEFVKHKAKLNVYYPDVGQDEVFTWSKWKRENPDNRPFIDEFHQYVENNVTSAPLVLMNNDVTLNINNAKRIPHNTHGQNDLMKYSNILLESTMNPESYEGKWLMNQVKEHDPRHNDIENEFQWVYEARTGYVYYQTLMRTCLRKGKTANVFVIDERAIKCFASLFTDLNMIGWKPKQLPGSNKPIGRPVTGQKCTPSEKNKAGRLKKKHPEKYKDMSAREILDSLGT